jgi:hypothetical protein
MTIAMLARERDAIAFVTTGFGSHAMASYTAGGGSVMADSDFAWLVENSPQFYDTYAGKWVAVRDGEVIGVGETAVEAAEQARQHAADDEFVLEAVDREADVIYGGIQLAATQDEALR